MAPTVIPNMTGRVQINYVRGGNAAVSNFFVYLTEVSTDVYKIANLNVTVSLTLTEFWALLDSWWLPLIPTTATVTSIYLWRYEDGAWFFVEGISPSAAGTGSETPDPCTFLNVSLRDSAMKFGHFTVTEPSFAISVASKKHGETWSALAGFIAELCSGSGSGTDVGSMIVSRGRLLFKGNPNWTIKVSDRIRRERGYI